MGKFIFAVVAAVASLNLAETLICNKCSFSLFGYCRGAENITCTSDNSSCFSGKLTFPVLPEFVGFAYHGCLDNTTFCNQTTEPGNSFFSYKTNLTCCPSNRCNNITLNAAPSTKMTVTAAVGGAILASMLGSIL